MAGVVRCIDHAGAELMREYKRSIDKATREIEKERTKLQNQEKKIIADIKKAAKDGQMVGPPPPTPPLTNPPWRREEAVVAMMSFRETPSPPLARSCLIEPLSL